MARRVVNKQVKRMSEANRPPSDQDRAYRKWQSDHVGDKERSTKSLQR